MTKPLRGEIWLIDLNPTKGREQRGRRPCLILSSDRFNLSPAELAIVLPMTTRNRGIPSHVSIDPPEGGVRAQSFIKCEDIRSVSTTERFVERWGLVEPRTMVEVEKRIRWLLEL